MVGLGNPGPAYSNTRHNVGFRAVDALAGRLRACFRRPLLRRVLVAEARWRQSRIRLVKPLSYMNRSGDIFPWLLRAAGREAGEPEVLVICDTLDLPPGACRLRRRRASAGGGAGGHKGLESIIRRTGGRDFLRLYIGIGRPDQGREVVGYVLGEPSGRDAELIAAAVDRAADAVLRLPDEGPERVMNELNQIKTG